MAFDAERFYRFPYESPIRIFTTHTAVSGGGGGVGWR